MSGAEEDRKRAQRAEQVALFRYQLIREAADPGLTVRQRGRMVREIAGTEHPGPFGEPVTVSRATVDRWIRAWRSGGFAALAPPGPAGHAADRPGGAGAGRRAEAGEPGADRGAGGADPAKVVRLVAVGADAAAALRPAGADRPSRRAGPGGVRPVRGAGAERHLDRGRAARAAGRGPQGLPVRLPGRPLEGGDGGPLGLFRGQRAAGRRAAPGAGRPRHPVPDLRR